MDNKLQQNDPDVVVAPTVNSSERLPSDSFKHAPQSPVGLRLFPKFFPDTINQKKNPLVDRPSLVRFFPKTGEEIAVDSVGNIDGEDGVPGGGNDGDSGGGHGSGKKVIGGIVPPRRPTEKTISVPKFKTDYKGNWVYNPWGVTFGQLWRDTRYKEVTIHNMPHKWPQFDTYTKAFDNKKIRKPKVCNSFSTIYNKPRVMEYLKKAAYNSVRDKWPIYKDLRWQIYKDGDSEECHTPEQTHWRTFMECSLMRNMRMDYLVPRYPLRQTAGGLGWDYRINYPNFWIDDLPDRDPIQDGEFNIGKGLDRKWGEKIAYPWQYPVRTIYIRIFFLFHPFLVAARLQSLFYVTLCCYAFQQTFNIMCEFLEGFVWIVRTLKCDFFKLNQVGIITLYINLIYLLIFLNRKDTASEIRDQTSSSLLWGIVELLQ